VLTDAITEATTCFTNIKLVTQFASYAINNIGRKAGEVVSDFMRRLRSGNASLRTNEGASITTRAAATKSAGFLVGRQGAFDEKTSQVSSALAGEQRRFVENLGCTSVRFE